MRLAEVLGYRSFATEEDIKRQALTDEKGGVDQGASQLARALLIFDTSKQKTWLAVAGPRFMVILDDVRRDSPRIQWTADLRDARNMKLKKKDKTESVGTIDFGPTHGGWLYTKRLFQDEDVLTSIGRFIDQP